jgi:hypothetical protein
MSETHMPADANTLLTRLQEAHIRGDVADDPWGDKGSLNYWTYDGSFEEALLFPNRLPDELPFQFPLPAHARLIGSARPLPRSEIEVVLETDVEPKRFVEEYRLQLEALGWKPLCWFPPQYGFGPSSFPWLGGFLYRSDDRVGLTFTAFQPDGGHGLVHLEADWIHGDLISFIEFDATSAQVIPLLPAPPGSEFSHGKLSASDGISEGRVSTEMTLLGLHAYYAAQLEVKGWRRTDLTEEATRIASAWVFTIDGDEHPAELTVTATGAPREYALRLESVSASQISFARILASIEAEPPDASFLKESLWMLEEYDKGSSHAYLSPWARAEQVRPEKELTLEDRAIVRRLLDLPEDEAVRREALLAVGPGRAYNLLFSVIRSPGYPDELESVTVENYDLYLEQQAGGVSFLLREAKVGLTAIVVTAEVWTSWPVDIAWPDDPVEEPSAFDTGDFGLERVTDDLGTSYQTERGLSESIGPIRVTVDGEERLSVGEVWRWAAAPGPPRNAQTLTLHLQTKLSVLQPGTMPPPWPSQRIIFPHSEFAFSLGDRKKQLEALGVPLPRVRGHRVQL